MPTTWLRIDRKAGSMCTTREAVDATHTTTRDCVCARGHLADGIAVQRIICTSFVAFRCMCVRASATPGPDVALQASSASKAATTSAAAAAAAASSASAFAAATTSTAAAASSAASSSAAAWQVSRLCRHVPDATTCASSRHLWMIRLAS